MSWGTDLWDQYEVVCNHTDQGIEFIKRVSNFVKDRIHAEQQYARELRQLAKKYTKKDEVESKYSSVRAFAKMVAETNDLAGQRELIAESMKSEVMEPLKHVTRDLAMERKKIMVDGTEELRRMKAQLVELEKTKQRYDKSCEELEQARAQFEKADADPNITRAKIEKFQNTVRQKETACEEAKNNYWLTVENTNKVQRQHYESDMPAIFTRFQEMDCSRMKTFGEHEKLFADCQRRVMHIVGKCLDNIDEAANSIKPEADCQQLVESHKSGFSPPGDVVFQEYGRQAVKKTTHGNIFGPAKGQKAEPKEDFSHLPPAQQKKKLKGKISELESAVQKSTADKNAMDKMIAIYRQNPSLGDEKAVAQSLEPTLVRLDEQNAELYKFKCYLHKMEGKEAPNKPQFVSSKPPPLVSFDQLLEHEKPSESPPLVKKPAPKPAKPSPATPKNTTSPAPPQDEFDDEDDDEEEDEDVPGEGSIARVLYDFEAQNPEELSVHAEDRVTVVEIPGDGWMKIRSERGEGYIPESYAQIEQ